MLGRCVVAACFRYSRLNRSFSASQLDAAFTCKSCMWRAGLLLLRWSDQELECCNHEHTALATMMRAIIVVVALAAAAFDQRPPVCTSIFCNWRSFHNSVCRPRYAWSCVALTARYRSHECFYCMRLCGACQEILRIATGCFKCTPLHVLSYSC